MGDDDLRDDSRGQTDPDWSEENDEDDDDNDELADKWIDENWPEFDESPSYYGLWERKRRAENFKAAEPRLLARFFKRKHVFTDKEVVELIKLNGGGPTLEEAHRELDVFAVEWAWRWSDWDISLADMIADIEARVLGPALALHKVLQGKSFQTTFVSPRFPPHRMQLWAKEVHSFVTEVQAYLEGIKGFRRRGRSARVVLKHHFVYGVDALCEYFSDDEDESFLNYVDDEQVMDRFAGIVLLISKRIFPQIDPKAKGMRFNRELAAFRRFEHFGETADIMDARWHRFKVRIIGP